MRIKHVVAGVTVAAGALLLSGCDWQDFANENFSDEETLSAPVGEVRFSNDSGDVTITEGDELTVRYTVSYSDTRPGKTYRVDGDTLVLEPCQERDCRVSYDVTVPEGTAVSGQLDSGDVEIVGAASVNVAAESGNVTVRDVGGEVNATAQSGNVELSGIGGAVVAAAESGNVSVGMTSARTVTATASSGNLDVTVPEGDYQVQIQTSSDERVTNEVGDADSGPAIELRTDSGDVNLTHA